MSVPIVIGLAVAPYSANARSATGRASTSNSIPTSRNAVIAGARAGVQRVGHWSTIAAAGMNRPGNQRTVWLASNASFVR